MIYLDSVDRFLLTMTALCALMCSVAGAAEYRQEIGNGLFGPRPVVLRQMTRGVPGCESGKWECLRDVATGHITMRHPEQSTTP